MRWYFIEGALFGAPLSLEGFRRTFLGGTFLSLFIVKEFGLQPHALETIERLRGYLDIEASMINKLKIPFLYWIRPWQDHNKAGRTFLSILEILAESEFPGSCQWYWNQPGYPEKKT